MAEHPGSFDNPFTAERFGPFTGNTFGPSGQFGAIDFFEETNPQALFSARVNQATPSFNQRNRLNNLFSQIFQQYQGVLAQQALSGGLPTTRFTDFLGGSTPAFGGVENLFGSLSPAQLGTSSRTFAPPTRFL